MSGQCKIQNLITIPISHQNTILLSVHTLPSITSFTGISRLAICTKHELKKYKKEDFLCAECARTRPIPKTRAQVSYMCLVCQHTSRQFKCYVCIESAQHTCISPNAMCHHAVFLQW